MDSIRDLLRIERPEIHVMPIVRFTATAHVSFWHRIGLEALARGPAGSPLRSPVALFSEARAMGLEQELDLLCISNALPLTRRMASGQRLFVNVLPNTLLHPQFMPTLEAHLPSNSRQKLVLEVLEGPLQDLSAIRRVLRLVSELGIHIAIDDVNLSELEMIRVEQFSMAQYLKIDREVMMGSWPENPEMTRDWLRDLQKLAVQRGAQVLMEGIEPSNREQLLELNGLGVAHGQGYLFGAPTPHLPDEILTVD